MAITQADIDRLDACIVRGELTVEFNGRRISYRSISELKSARQHAAEILAAQAAPSTQPTTGAFTVGFSMRCD